MKVLAPDGSTQMNLQGVAMYTLIQPKSKLFNLKLPKKDWKQKMYTMTTSSTFVFSKARKNFLPET